MSERLRVLLVEDNPADVDLIRETLPESGPVTFRLESVSRLAEARARVATGDLDLILLDLGLPDSHGLATFDSLREAAPAIPIVVLTGNDDEEAAVAAVRQGAQDYLIKGQVVGNLLVRAARYAVERRREEEALRASEERFRHLFESMELGVVYQAADGRIVSANPAAERILGLTLDQLMGRVSTDPRWRCLHENGSDFRGEEHPAMVALRSGRPVLGTMMGVFHPVENQHRWILVDAVPEFRPGDATPFRVYATFSDITQLRRTEEDLRKSEARSLRLLDNVPFPLCHVTKAGVIAFRNKRFVEVFGYTADDVPTLGEWWLRAYPDPHYRQWVTATWDEAVRRAAAEGRDIDAIEYRVTCKSGEERVVEISGITLGEEFLATFIDITERKRAEEALRESEERHRALFEKSRDALMTLAAPLWRFSSGNPATVAMFGARDEADFISRAPWEFSPGRQPDGSDSATKAQEMIATAVREGSHFFEWTHKRLTGEEFSASVLLSRMEIGGQPLVQATVRDETARKRAEERIVHLNRILRAVRDINQLIVRERDRQRLIEDTCRLLVESRGYRSAMVILSDAAGVPQSWAEAGMGEVFQPLAESLRLAILPACCRLAEPREGVYHITDREEVCRLCPIGTDCASSDASCIQLRHGGTTYGYLAVSVDRALGVDAEEDSLLGEVAGDVAFALHGIERAEAMTQVEADRDRAENALRQSQKMEAIGRLAGGVAHDFNNILTVITASCSFLEDGLHAPDPLLDDVRTVRDAAQSAVKLTRQLLAFGRRQVLEPRPLDLNALVAESEKMLGRLIGEDVAIRVEPAPALGFALADPGQLEQVIINLAVNSRDAMPEGGTLTIATANVELDETFVDLHAGSSTGPFVRLAVSDTGVGMDAETVVRIFEPFFTTKAVGKGTGLGLSTVYGIVKQSGGFIAVDSAPGRGATFAIYLPRVEPAGQPWRPPTEAQAARGRGETILLVEDNDLLRTAATRMLTRLGYRIFAAAGIDEAKRIAATEGPIHLLLTDVVMPGGSGRDVSLAVAAAHPAAKVLYMSGFTDDVIIQRGVLNPGVAFLLKPFTPDSLGRKLREVLDG